MTEKITVLRKRSEIKNGRKVETTSEFYRCWCKVQSLGTTEKYNALQTGLDNTIVFKVRNCFKMNEIRLNLKEFYAVYKNTEFKIYDASPMVTAENMVLLKCRIGA